MHFAERDFLLGVLYAPHVFQNRRAVRHAQSFEPAEREPGLPLRIGNSDAMLERLAQRRQLVSQMGIFGEQRALLPLSRLGAAHVSDKMRHDIEMGDVDIELVECVAGLPGAPQFLIFAR